ncbi:class D sortase [Hathewaya massiliensis]|uniref:class D sortase n=1 Tax=Hathewaya massiliensis TaxID=1964382 RepID=UPI0011574477|nr:class D sortase [Hathewaya massiliensis]
MKKNIISILLIILGITLILASLSIKVYSKNKESQLIDNFNSRLNAEKNERELIEHKHGEDESNKKEVKIGDEISTIEIPSINLKSVIVEGIGKDQLRYALGHFKDTAMPGEYGNFSVAGHSSSIYKEILNNLYKVEIGDEIILKTLKGKFEYKITDKFVVEPTEINVLEQDKNKKNITIVTCTDGGEKRLIIKGEYKEIIKTPKKL